MGTKVLLLNPPGPRALYRDFTCSSLSKATYVWKPRGHIMFSSIIPPEWDARFIDASIQGLSSDETLKEARSYQPDIVAIALSSINWDGDYAFMKELRAALPGAHLIAFGDVMGEEYFFAKVIDVADEVVYNPFLYHIRDYRERKSRVRADNEYRQGSKQAKAVQSHVSRYQLFDSTRYRWPFVKHFRYAAVYTQFGCPMSCMYCTSAKTAVTYRPAGIVLEEIAAVHRDGYREIHFGDDTFGTPKENAANILEGMLKAGYRFSWSAYTHPAVADYGYLKLMKESGCHTLVIGLDSHDFGLLRKYGRFLTREKALDFIANCKKLGIEVCGDFILGFEEEDEASVLKTIAFALECGVDYASMNCASPMMNTVIREQKTRQGVIAEGDVGFDTAGYRVTNTAKLSGRRLKELHTLAVRRFYMRPAYLLKRAARVRSAEELMLRLSEGCGVVRNILATRH